MKKSRDDSEERFYQFLLKAGFKESDIKEPDSDSTVIGTADFVVRDVVFEVKKITPKEEDFQEIKRMKKILLEDGGVAGWSVPDVREQFKEDIQNARTKFKKYSNCATVLVEDLTEWWWMEPDLEKLLFGIKAIHVDSISGNISRISWKDRELQLNKNQSIGSYIFMYSTSNKMLIHHNLMASDYKMMPLEFMYQFRKVASNQYIFMNLPGGPPLLRELM